MRSVIVAATTVVVALTVLLWNAARYRPCVELAVLDHMYNELADRTAPLFLNGPQTDSERDYLAMATKRAVAMQQLQLELVSECLGDN